MRDQILALLTKYMSGPFKPSGDNIMTRCPFHKDGQEATPSFGINVLSGLFNCFSCKRKGDLQVLLKELGVSASLVESELKLIAPELERSRELHKVEMKNLFSHSDPFRSEFILSEVILGIYEFMPASLAAKGFSPAILQSMEVGFDKKAERITYPIRDIYGNLAGISGGASKLDQWPKYRVYQGGRTESGKWLPGDYGDWFDQQYPGYRCENHHYLWNYHKVFPNIVANTSDAGSTIYVVEGFKACLWMIQAGFPNTVAIMGSALTEHQQRLLHRCGGTVVLCLDNDDAGKKATQTIGNILWKPMYGRLKALTYPTEHSKTQPDDYPLEQLSSMVHAAAPFVTSTPLRRH